MGGVLGCWGREGWGRKMQRWSKWRSWGRQGGLCQRQRAGTRKWKKAAKRGRRRRRRRRRWVC